MRKIAKINLNTGEVEICKNYTKGKLEIIHELNVQSNINREFIASCGCNGRDIEENKANAKRIVKCWNNFDKLVEACRKASTEIYLNLDEDNPVLIILNKVIKEAKE